MRLTIALAALSLLAGACAVTTVPFELNSPEEIEVFVDSLFDEFNQPGSPGACVGIFYDDEIAFQKAYGLACIEDETPNSPETDMRLASITKQFTAMAILILRERGELDFDAPITAFFTDFPEIYQTITVRHLLTHTSGIVAYEDLMPPDQTEQIYDREVLDLLRTQHGTYFTPGTEYRYSNSGYSVLAMIVEEVSGKPFPEFLHDEIFAPLGMDNTVAFVNGVNEVPNRAFGYKRGDNGGFEFSDQSSTSAVLGDGGIYSSIHDLYRWDRALWSMAGVSVSGPPPFDHPLISRASMQEAFTPVTLPNGESTGYGFGWRVEERNGTLEIWHSGSTCGFHNAIIRVPEHHLTVVVLMNLRGGGATDAGHAIVDWLLAEERHP